MTIAIVKIETSRRQNVSSIWHRIRYRGSSSDLVPQVDGTRRTNSLPHHFWDTILPDLLDVGYRDAVDPG